MKVVGFRCFKESISFVALDGTASRPKLGDHGNIPFPKGQRPEQLAWLRREVLEILHRERPSAVGFKGIEGSAQTKDTGRAEAEGVMQEAGQDFGVPPLRRLKKQIKADLSFPDSARYVERALTSLPSLPVNRREAALAALAVLTRG